MAEVLIVIGWVVPLVIFFYVVSLLGRMTRAIERIEHHVQQHVDGESRRHG